MTPDFELIKTELTGMKVLYAEDDPMIQEQLTLILEKFGLEVLQVQNGEEGLGVLEQQRPDFVITDVKMPIMDGLEMLKKIKAIVPDIPLIIVSAFDEPKILHQAIEIGVDHYLIKPLQTKQLVSVLKKIATYLKNLRADEAYLKEVESQLFHKVFEVETKSIQDELTGLKNSIALHQRITGGQFRVMVLNIDYFGLINNAYGYDQGDHLLRQFGHYLVEHASQYATIYRLSGDQFVILCQKANIQEMYDNAALLQERIRKHPFLLGKTEILLTCSMGIGEGEGNEALIHAFISLAHGKKLGPGRVGYIKMPPNMKAIQQENLQKTHLMREAIEKDWCYPVFQPIVDNRTGEIKKYECLIRIIKDGQVYAPGAFLPYAKITGLVTMITRLMVQKSFAYFSRYPECGFTINITEEDLQEDYLAEFLQKEAKAWGIAAERVTLEILENISAGGSEAMFTQIKEFKSLGFKIALDDFGSEMSNFHRLMEMDVDVIKIDGMYIKSLTENERSVQVVDTITRFAHNIGAKVVAEFVHNEAVAKKVKEMGIDYSQGYYYSEPKNSID